MIRTVVHYSDSREFGGAEQAILHLIAGLDGHRWRQVLFHHAGAGTAPLTEGARALGVEVRSVPPIWRAADARRGLLRFVRELRAARPAVFHSHLTSAMGGKYGLVGAALARVPAIVATAQLYVHVPPGWQLDLNHRIARTCVDRYIAVSDEVAERLRERFRIPEAKLVVIHNAVPVARFAITPNATLRAELMGGVARPVVLTVARLDKQKGHPYLLEAAVQLPDVVFVFAGDGPDRAALEARAATLGVSERVRFLGYRSDVAALLAACDLFVLPSLYEGLPLSVLEAMAAGKAVVASAIGGTDEAVVHGETGILVPPAEASSLADAIRTLLADPARSARLGVAGRERVRRLFSTDGMVARVAAVYEALLIDSKSGGHVRG
jgi:glycosyltransferase involved in cell wall biosynthesis